MARILWANWRKKLAPIWARMNGRESCCWSFTRKFLNQKAKFKQTENGQENKINGTGKKKRKKEEIGEAMKER